jgi:hypothetical protein
MKPPIIMKDGLPGITRASFEHDNGEVVVRNRTRALSLTVTAGIFLAVMYGASIRAVHGHKNAAASDAIAIPIICAVVFYAAWLVAWRTTIRLRTDGITLENVFLCRSIPWRQGRQLYLSRGLRLRLLDGRTYSVWAFQGSNGAAFTGYAAFKPIVERLTAECDRIVAEHPPEYPPSPVKTRIQIPDWWVPLVVAAGAEAVIWITTLAS